jgi:ABC-type transporter MlaC component
MVTATTARMTTGLLTDDATVTIGQDLVRTTAVTNRGEPVPLDDRMVLRDARWRIDDVVIDCASLLGSYRSQFQQIIKTSSYEALVEKFEQ